jgi:hypothetical protein
MIWPVGKMPSADFAFSAAYWLVMILVFNLNVMMKKMVLRGSWQSVRMKAVRFSLINLPGRVLKRSRRLIIQQSKNYPSLELLIEARKKIAMVKPQQQRWQLHIIGSVFRAYSFFYLQRMFL